MNNAQEYKPIVTELTDLMNQQKNLAVNLLRTVKNSIMIRNYIGTLDVQAEALEKIVRMTQISFENEEFKKLEKQK